MIKSILILVFSLPLTLIGQECRYNQRIFDSVTKASNITYATSQGIPAVYLTEAFTTTQNLKLDVFQPFNDTALQRALIIFAHPGGFISGSRSSDDMVSLCDSFSKRGYVTATMDYRMNFNLFSSNSAERAVWRATQDASAAIRYFKANAALYKIDTSKIFFWGSSAGSFMGVHVAYVDDAERPVSTFSASLQPDLGCKNCTGVTGPHNSEFAGVISCWGAISDTTWMNNNTVPLLMFHGDADAIVPITIGPPFNLATLPSVIGSGYIHNHLTNRNVPHQYYSAAGEPHEYWGTSNGTFFATGPTIYWQDIINKSRDFLLSTMGLPLICNSVLPFTNFSCKTVLRQNNVVEIVWNDETSSKTRYYVIEYSLDATNWKKAGSKSASSSLTSYSIQHNVTEQFTKLYYRIKAVSKDGNTSVSPVVFVINNTKVNDLVIYPNPSKDYIVFNNSTGVNSTINRVKIYDLLGKVVKEISVSIGQKISIKDLSNGWYFMKANASKTAAKFLVNK